jgi:hypothetical protein
MKEVTGGATSMTSSSAAGGSSVAATGSTVTGGGMNVDGLEGCNGCTAWPNKVLLSFSFSPQHEKTQYLQLGNSERRETNFCRKEGDKSYLLTW